MGTFCMTCRVTFSMPELQREHHKSDWHRYNLKRKIADLPPVTVDAFNTKVAAQQGQQNEEKDEGQRCEACKKSFNTTKSWENHCNSKKHKENVMKPARSRQSSQNISSPSAAEEESRESTEEDGNEEEEWEEEDGGLGLEECLFCDNVAVDMDTNLTHMSVKHSFFVPDLQYCINVSGFLTYLGEKVALGTMCLWCNESGKRFDSLDAVRKHMKDKGHCRMAHDSDAWLEYADFYDFTSSYPEGEQNPDDPAEIPLLEEKDWQLILPSGASVGHRQLRRYFRQRFNPENSSLVLKNNPNAHRKPSEKLLSNYRSLGWVSKEPAVRMRARDIGYLHKLRQRAYMKLGIKGNKNLQHHFRQATP